MTSLGTAFAWGLLPALFVLFGVWWLDRNEREPITFLATAVIFGGVIVPLLAAGPERVFDLPRTLVGQGVVPHSTLSVGGPLVEELALAITIAALLVVVRTELDGVLDGVVYGAAVGLGLDGAANFVSILQTPTVGNTSSSLFASMLGGLNQAFYGAVLGAGLAYAYTSPSTRRGMASIGAGFAVAFGAHLLHDYGPWAVSTSADAAQSDWLSRFAGAIPGTIGIVGLGALGTWLLAREAVLISRELAPEVETGVLTVQQYRTVLNPTARFLAVLGTLAGSGVGTWWNTRKLYGDAVELAFRKHHDRGRRSPAANSLTADEYRARIRALRAAIASEGNS